MLALRLRYVFHATSPVSGGAPLRLGSLIASERDAPAEALLGLRQGQFYVAGDSDILLSRFSRGEGLFCPSIYIIAIKSQIVQKNQKKFYDALTKPQAIKDFYENTELIAITKELEDTLRKNRTIDWQKRDSARAKMRMMIKRLLTRHRYPPEGMDDAVQTVMTQCELWTDNNDMESA